MANPLGCLKKRFISKLRRPFCYRKACKNEDGLLHEPIVDSGGSKALFHKSPKLKNCSCKGWLRAKGHRGKNKKEKPRVERDLFSTEITEIDDFDENRNEDTAEDGELSQTKPPTQERRRSSTFQKLKSWVKAEHRRDAICEQMEREIEMRGVSLRQYRKFLATSHVLYDLKML